MNVDSFFILFFVMIAFVIGLSALEWNSSLALNNNYSLTHLISVIKINQIEFQIELSFQRFPTKSSPWHCYYLQTRIHSDIN